VTLVWLKVTPEKHEETQRNKVTPEKHEGYDKETQRNKVTQENTKVIYKHKKIFTYYIHDYNFSFT
tara:strand:- start:102 stop:299 length:198 start_codon:yes stop_codon:yes gene_type:complete